MATAGRLFDSRVGPRRGMERSVHCGHEGGPSGCAWRPTSHSNSPERNHKHAAFENAPVRHTAVIMGCRAPGKDRAGLIRYACATFCRGRAKPAKIGGFRFARPPLLSGSRRAATKLDGPGLVKTPDVPVCRQDSLPRDRPIEAGAVIERQHSRHNRSDGRDFDLPRPREAILLRPRRGNAPLWDP